MKKSVKFISAVVTAAMAMTTFAGCSQSGSSSDKWYIGGIGPTTGAAAIYGNAVKNAAQLAVDEINAAGGINGYSVEYRFEDDQHDAEKSVNAYNTLKDWGMQVLMGCVTTGPCVAVCDYTAADNMFQLTPSASSTDVIANSNTFQICFTDPNQGLASADYIADNAIAADVAIIYNSSDIYSTGIHDTFVSQAQARGINVVSDTAFTDDTKTDFSTQLQQAMNAGAELLFLPIYYQEASVILQQANDMDYAPIFFGVDGMDGILTLDGFDTSLAEGVILLTPFAADAQDDATVSFVTKYQEAYGDIPNQFAADAYDAIYVIKAAIEHANLTPDQSVSDICDGMTAAMLEISYNGLTSTAETPLTWDATGAVSKGPKAVVIENGVYVAL